MERVDVCDLEKVRSCVTFLLNRVPIEKAICGF